MRGGLVLTVKKYVADNVADAVDLRVVDMSAAHNLGLGMRDIAFAKSRSVPFDFLACGVTDFNESENPAHIKLPLPHASALPFFE